jgi:cell division protein FtsA
MEYTEEYIVGLDLGTTKVCAIVGVLDKYGKVNIKGMGVVPSRGSIVRGSVENVRQVTDCIKEAVKKAGDQANIDIYTVNVGIAGYHIRSFKERCSRVFENSIITEENIELLLEDAKRLKVPTDSRIIHAFPEEYIINGVNITRNPVGNNGGKVEGKYHIVTAHANDLENIKKSISDANLQIDQIIYQPLASAEAILVEEEKKAGVAVIDIGGGSTDLAVFKNGQLVYACVIPVGGTIINKDIETACSIVDHNDIERLKIKYGVAFQDFIKENLTISVRKGLPYHDPVEISQKNLTMIIQTRLEEIFSQVDAILAKEGFTENKLIAGIVLTGGTSNLPHITDLCELMTGLKVRTGNPGDYISDSVTEEARKASYATAIGLVKMGGQAAMRRSMMVNNLQETQNTSKKTIESKQSDLLDKLKEKVKGLFSMDNLFGGTTDKDYND